MKKYLVLIILLCNTFLSRGQVLISDAYNDGSHASDFSNEEYVVNGSLGFGYRSVRSGIFDHFGPAVNTLTVKGEYNAFFNPLFPGIDNFLGLDGLKNSGVQLLGDIAATFGIINLDHGSSQVFSLLNTSGANVGSRADFKNGISTTVRSNNSNGALRFLDNATYTNTALGDAQYVNGYVSKIGNDAFIFPVGDQSGTDLRTLSISAPASATDHLSVAYWRGNVGANLDPTGGAHDRTALNTAGSLGTTRLISVSPLCFWDWVPVAGSSSLAINISIPDFSVQGGYYVASGMRVVGWNTTTSQWDNLSGATGASSNAEGTVMTGTVSNMSLYSAIAIGSVSTFPLAVKLIGFDVYKKETRAFLQWATSSETNNKGFIIERSNAGVIWNEIGFVDSKSPAGNSNTRLEYDFTDVTPLTGSNLYRLKQLDFDGKVEYSSVRRLNFSHENPVTVYPNPAKDNITLTGLSGGEYITLYNISGAVVSQIQNNNNRNLDIKLDKLTDGVYHLRILSKSGVITIQKIVKSK